MKSTRGVYYNLSESEYEYSIDNFIFVFSSLFYLNSFKDKLEEFITFEQNKINNKLKCSIDSRELILLNRYKNIEKRGFLVYYNDKVLKEYKFISKLEMRKYYGY